jgi:hypothetical protein
LIHDFSEGSHGSGDENSPARLTGEYSITLNGTCSVIKDGEHTNATFYSIIEMDTVHS